MRRITRGLVASAMALALVPLAAPGAQALDSSIAFTADELPTWQTNGIVWAVAQAGGKVFAGGSFTTVRAPQGSSGSQARANLVVLDARTGAPTTCRIDVTRSGGAPTVRALNVSPDGRTLYIGGYFTAVQGQARTHLAAVDIASCTVRADFKPTTNATIRAIASTASTVYVGGDLTQVGGQARGRAGAVTTAGAVLPWNPQASLDSGTSVRALAIDPRNGNIVVGGTFPTLRGLNSYSLGVVNGSTGAVVRAYPLGFFPKYSVVKAIATDSTGFYTGNEGTGYHVFDGRIAVNWGTYNQRWRDNCYGATQALVSYKNVIYSGSHAHDCSPIGGYKDGRRQHLLAEPAQGSTPRLLPWYPDTNDGIGEHLGPRAMVVAPAGDQDYLWVAGEFTSVNGKPQQGLTRFGNRPDTGAPTTPSIAASVVSGKKQVRWTASHDKDDALLTYRVYRDGGANPVWTGTATSSWWSRPTVTFTDSVAGRHSYRVRVGDAAGNTSPLSNSVTVG